MKEQVLTTLTEKALTYLNSAEAFLGKEIPIYIQEFLEFKFMEHCINLCFETPWLLLILALIIAIYKGFRHLAEDKDIVGDVADNLTALLGVASIFTLVLIGFTFEDIARESLLAYKAAKAPRVYLIDHFSKQVKK